MPGDESSSIYPDAPDPLALIQSAVDNVLDAPLALCAGNVPLISEGNLALPPIAGGALPEFLEDAWGWVENQLLGPASGFLLDKLKEVGRLAAAAVTTVLTWILRPMYQFIRTALWWRIPETRRGLYPDPARETVFGLYAYLGRPVRMVVDVIEGLVSDIGSWLWGLVKGIIGTAWSAWGSLSQMVRSRFVDLERWVEAKVTDIGDWLWGLVKGIIGAAWSAWGSLSQMVRARFADLERWVWDKVTDIGDWLWGLVKGIIGIAGDAWGSLSDMVRKRFADLERWVEDKVFDAGRWVWDQVSGIGGTIASGVAGLLEDGWRWLRDNVLSKIVDGVVAGATAIGDTIQRAFEWLVNDAFGPFVEVVEGKLAIPGKLVRAEYGSFAELLDDILDPPREMLTGWTGMIALPFIIIGLLVNIVTGLGGPLLEPVLQEQARNVGARIPPFQVLRDGLRRGELPEGVHDEWMGRSGYDEENIALQKALYEEIPGPTDLVRFAVREAFDKPLAESLGYVTKLPGEFASWMAKQGYTTEWADRYWWAHWDLPSVSQGFEMFHRGQIDEGELRTLLKVLDLPPLWHDRFIGIAYNIITRVDIRRMYQAGVVDRGKVEETYRHMGYTPEDAGLLTDWVVKYYTRSGEEGGVKLRENIVSVTRQAYARRLISRDAAVERLRDADYTEDEADLQVSIWDFDFFLDPSQRSDVDPKALGISVIETAYQRRLVDFNAAVTELGELGYTPEDAKLRLQLVDLKLEEALADLEIDAALDEYTAGLIDDATFAARLGDLNVPETRVDYLVRKAILERQVKDRRLTLSQMKRAVAAAIMSEEEYRFRLDAMGYNQRDVEILVALEVGAV